MIVGYICKTKDTPHMLQNTKIRNSILDVYFGLSSEVVQWLVEQLVLVVKNLDGKKLKKLLQTVVESVQESSTENEGIDNDVATCKLLLHPKFRILLYIYTMYNFIGHCTNQ